MRIIVSLIGCILFLTDLLGQTTAPKLIITHLSGDFYIYQTYNTYKGSRISANAMYLVTDKGVVLFDTPWDTTQFQPLIDSIQARHQQKVVICIATHSHEDRTGGLGFLNQKGVKTYTTTHTDKISKENGRQSARYLIKNDTSFEVGKYRFQTYYAGQGHTPDNVVVWFEKERILYGGCLIKSIEAKDLGNLADANVKEWAFTLRRIQTKCLHPQFIITGHDDWTSKQSINHTLRLIKEFKKKNEP